MGLLYGCVLNDYAADVKGKNADQKVAFLLTLVNAEHEMCQQVADMQVPRKWHIITAQVFLALIVNDLSDFI